VYIYTCCAGLIAQHGIAGYNRQPNRPRLLTVTSGDAQTSRVARPRGHAQPPPRSARHAADAGCSACFSNDTGLAAVELLIRIFFPAKPALPVGGSELEGRHCGQKAVFETTDFIYRA